MGLAVVSCLLAWARPSTAAQGDTVLTVEVQGTRTIAQETCLARIQIARGMAYTDSLISEDIRRLYALGYFTDVRVETESLPDGLRVIFHVTEKPAIASIEAEGNHQIRNERVQSLVGLTLGELFDPRKLKTGVDVLKAEYRRKGYAQVAIESSVVEDAAANMVTVYLVVDEGPRMRVTEVFVEGNLAFSDRRVRRLIKTKRKRFWTSGAYEEQVLDEDLERIRAFYRKRGYQDIAVTAKVAGEPSGDGLVVLFRLIEGEQHRVGQIQMSGTVLFPERELRELLQLKPGAVFNDEGVQADLRAVKQYYGDRGYINAQVVPLTQLDQATTRVNVTYQITENELVYIDRIRIRGNLRTKDSVVRRELRVNPGDPFDGKRVRRSIERLYNLGYFEEVTVAAEPTQEPNREDLVIEVKETKTGSFSFGGGFSSVDRVVGLVELEQRNFDWRNWPTFVGAGQDLRIGLQIGTVRRFFDLSFTEPWIFGRPLSFGVDAFSRTRLRSRNLGLAFEEERRGAGIRLGREFSDTVRLDTRYQLFRTEISDVAGDASGDLKAEAGRSDISVVGATLSWDTRDNRFDPTRGSTAFASVDWAGGVLAGDREFYRFQGGASHYVPHYKDRLILETRVRGGIVNAYSDSAEVPIFERFFAGGSNTIRGFQERRVGPRDPTSNDPIGGEAFLIATIEEVMTLISNERGRPVLKGAVFYDAGDVWRRVNEFAESLKSGVGIGVRVNTPIGPLRLDVGFPISQVEEEKRKPRLHFNISRSF